MNTKRIERLRELHDLERSVRHTQLVLLIVLVCLGVVGLMSFALSLMNLRVYLYLAGLPVWVAFFYSIYQRKKIAKERRQILDEALLPRFCIHCGSLIPPHYHSYWDTWCLCHLRQHRMCQVQT